MAGANHYTAEGAQHHAALRVEEDYINDLPRDAADQDGHAALSAQEQARLRNSLMKLPTPPPAKKPQPQQSTTTPTATSRLTSPETSTKATPTPSSGMTPRVQAWFQKIAHLPVNEQRAATDLLLRMSKRLREKRANVAAREAKNNSD